MRLSLSLKINLIVLLVVLALGSILGAAFLAEQRRTLDEELANRVRRTGLHLSRTLVPPLRRGDNGAVGQALQAAVLDREIAYAIVKSTGGEPQAARWEAHLGSEVVEYDFPLRLPSTAAGKEPAGDNVFGPVAHEAEGEALGRLAVGVDFSLQRARLHTLYRNTVIAVLGAAGFSLLLGLFFVRLLLHRSVRPLLDGIRAIGAGDLARRIGGGRDDEIGEIGRAFDEMADRLSRTLVTKEELEDTVAQRTAELSESLAERIRLEQQLVQSQKLEAIGVLAGGIAHDFNNLLTPILGYVELALRKMDEASPARKDMLVVLQSATRAADLTRQILAFSRKQVLEMKVLDLNEEVRGVGKMLGRLIGEDVALRLDLAPGLPCVKADPVQVQQVILNLAVNARDAMPDGGTLVIRTAPAEEAPGAPAAGEGAFAPRFVLLSVSDSGTGMDEETRGKIFEPFFTTKRQGKGTGLGLSTVYGIVKQHGGEIAVDTAPGRGATFRVYLPRAEESVPAVAEAPAADECPAAGSGRVLLVEDDESVRDFVGRVLEEHGYTVTRASGGADALREAAGAPFDLLVSDVIMPGMNGRDLYRELARVRPELKVLYVSGYPAVPGALSDLFDGGEPLLLKPFTPQALLDRVRAALGTAES